MLGILKWIWDKAEKHGREQVLAEIHSLRSYHTLKAEVGILKERYEPDDPKYGPGRGADFFMPRYSPKEHSAIARGLSEFISRYEKEQHGR